jgi:hypothetical protein
MTQTLYAHMNKKNKKQKKELAQGVGPEFKPQYCKNK